MSEFRKDINKISNHLIDLFFIAGSIISTIIVALVFVRDFPDNLGFTYYSQIFIVAVIWIVTLTRNKTPLSFKAYTLLSVIIAIVLLSFSKLGFVASAKLYIILTPVLASFMLSFKKSIYILIGFLLMYLFFGYMYSTGKLVSKVIANDFVLNIKSWIIEAFIIFLVSLCIIYVGNTYLKEVYKNLTIINEQNIKLKESQKLITEHRDNLQKMVDEKTQILAETIKELETKNIELNKKTNIIHNKNIELKETIQHLKDAQVQLIEAEKMASLGILTAGIAHEINNPLNYILGGTTGIENILAMKTGSNQKAEMFLGIIKEGVNRASSIVSGLNQLSRNNESYSEVCNLHEIIDNCLLILNNQLKHRITVNKNYCSSKVITQGNVGKLHQAFINILTNSSQAIEDKGEITITTDNKDNDILISIKDTGHGISQKDIKKITEPFFTTKDPGQGTGLGLSITYKIINDHKGKINFKSAPNQGTNAEILLPIFRT